MRSDTPETGGRRDDGAIDDGEPGPAEGGRPPLRRRRFLASFGATVAAGVLAGCNGELTEVPGNETATGTEELPEVSTRAPAYEEVTPSMQVDGFEITLFSDLQDLAEEVGVGVDLNAFDALVADGGRGFEPGLYVSIGPAIREVVNDDFRDAPRIFHVGVEGRARPFVSGQFGVETMTWAEGDYGDGILFTKPHSHQVGRALPDGTVETVAEDVGGPPAESPGPFPLGPAGIEFGPDGDLFVTNYFGKELLRVSPRGESENVLGGRLAIPSPTKALVADGAGQFGGDFLVGTFSLDPPESDGLYSVALDGGGEAEEVVGGLTGMEAVSRAEGGAFGEELYVPVAGPDQPATGSVYRLQASGELQPFVEGVDAANVAFDAEGTLGGGAFLTDFTNKGGSGRVFEITPQ